MTLAIEILLALLAAVGTIWLLLNLYLFRMPLPLRNLPTIR